MVTSSTPPLIGDITIEAFSAVARGPVLQTLADCSVEGKMEGQPIINFDVAGHVTEEVTYDVERDN